MSASYRSSFVSRVRSRPSSTVVTPVAWRPKLGSLLAKIDEFAKSLEGDPHVGADLERLPPLREACQADDYFFLAVHQVYCIFLLTRLFENPSLTGCHVDIAAAMPYLDLVFRTSSREISVRVIEWLSVFPGPEVEALPEYDQAVDRMQVFFQRLPLKWPELVVQCRDRGYPPLHQELDVLFRTRSITLQTSMFWLVVDLMQLPLRRYKEMYRIHRWDMYVCYYLAERLATARLPIDHEVETFNQHTVAMFRGACQIKRHLASQRCGLAGSRNARAGQIKRRPPIASGARPDAPRHGGRAGPAGPPAVQPGSPRAGGPAAGTSGNGPQGPNPGPSKRAQSEVIVVSSDSEGEARTNVPGPQPIESTAPDFFPFPVPTCSLSPLPVPPELDPEWSTLESLDHLLDPSREASPAAP